MTTRKYKQTGREKDTWKGVFLRAGAMLLFLFLLFLSPHTTQADTPEPNASELYTDHLTYFPGESVQISLPEGMFEAVVETPTATYRSVDAQDRMSFIPQGSGTYKIKLSEPGKNTFAEADFSVDSAIDVRIELKNRNGRPQKVKISRIDKQGEEYVVLEPEQEELSFVNSVEATVPVASGGLSALSTNPECDVTIEVESAPPEAPPGSKWKRAYYLTKSTTRSDVTVELEASGTALYRCAASVDGTCLSSWEKVGALTPGESYTIPASTGLFLYAESGISTINTEKPMYHPGETAVIWIAVLDSAGFPVSGADIVLTLTDPHFSTHLFSSSAGDITEIRKGVYETTFTTSYEGTHEMSAVSSTTEGESTIESTFEVASFFEFDILRNAPMIIDPWAPPFESKVTVEPFVSVSSFTLVERVPQELLIADLGGASISSSGGYWLLTWQGLVPGETVGYLVSAPRVSPVMYAIGPIEISHSGASFTEARSWLIAADPPPEQFGLAGWIFLAGGTAQVPLGTDYSINNSATSFFLVNKTRIPFPGYTGRYSETVTGNTNDVVVVRAWNDSHFGFNTIVLTGDMDNVNVTFNQTRVGEPNVTVVLPPDNTLYVIGDSLDIQANLSIDGVEGALNCNASVTFISPGVITLKDGEPQWQFLGNISATESVLINWSANASNEGVTDITVTVVCDDNLTSFDTQDSDSAYGQNVQKELPPLTPYGIAGWILTDNLSIQMPLGTPYSLNNTDSTWYVRNNTRIPFPGYTGRYSETIQGTTGDNLTLTAWNETHWGRNNVTLTGDMDGVNISLNLSRPSELNISFWFPFNNSFFTVTDSFENVTINITNIGGITGVNCSVTLNISNTSVVNITSTDSFTHQLPNISIGQTVLTTWNVSLQEFDGRNHTIYFIANASCDSDEINFDESDEATLHNVTIESLADLFVNETYLTFSDYSPQENITLWINATIFNIGNRNASNVTVQFFVDNITDDTQLNGNFSFNISGLSNVSASVNWTTEAGNHEIFVLVDPQNAIDEANETNNNASRNITIIAWQIYYGNLTGDILLSDAINASTLRWNTSRGGNIFVAETGSSINWNSLLAIGRNATQELHLEDFAEIDSLLNMSQYNDSVNRTFTDGNLPKELRSFFIYGNNISNVSVVNSTTTSAFQTGILWDSSDDSGNATFDADDKEDLVFVTTINRGQTGQYGTYDYEIRVPATLRRYKDGYGTVSFYVELK